MARASKTTTSTAINKYHFLFLFFIFVTMSYIEPFFISVVGHYVRTVVSSFYSL